MSRWLSRWCRPIDGSSSTYSTPTRPAADLGGQPDALGLAAGEGGGGADEREVVEADVEQEPHAGVDLLEHPLGDHAVALGQLEASRTSAASPIDIAQISAMLRPSMVTAERQRLEAGTAAVGARHLAHVALDLLALVSLSASEWRRCR